MLIVRFEPKTPLFERTKAVHTLYSAATVIGIQFIYSDIYNYFKF
jgi:hypothetical protein